MRWRKLLEPRYCLDRAIASVWGRVATPLPPPACVPSVGTDDLASMLIEWPTTYGWHSAARWVDPIRSGLSRYIVVCSTAIPQPPTTAVLVYFYFRGSRHNVIIDYSDYPDRILTEWLENCLVYLKMQYLREGYGHDRIVHGMYIPTGNLAMYRYLPRLRRLRDTCTRPKYDVYGRFGMRRANPVRQQAIQRLCEQDRFRFQGGGKLLALTRSLSEITQAKVCIDLPGSGPFCHRLVDYLAIGSCVVAYPHAAVFDPPLVDHTHIVYCKPDFSDLVDLCDYYVTHKEERQAIAGQARAYFDTYLHKDCIAVKYINTLAAKLGLL